MSEYKMGQIIVKKFGGATLSSPEKIKAVAQQLNEEHRKKTSLVVVVSAMGKTTNQLIELAHQISSNPSRREMDMLLSTGERVSMSLLSMALNDLKCPAISYTGSQAGIITDDSHSNAFIKDIKPFRVQQALQENKVVILAGFQGVSELKKEITTLGRGGSDTTAVAMAAALKAHHCEILKDVPAIFSADPHLVPEAKALKNLTYQQLLEMTFWGAKVLHYRSAELSLLQKVPLYIGPAHSKSEGTWIQGDPVMNEQRTNFETQQILSVNSHEKVLEIIFKPRQLNPLIELEKFLTQKEIYFPQVLWIQQNPQDTRLFLTAPSETIESILMAKTPSSAPFEISPVVRSTVSLTCTSNFSSELTHSVLKKMESHHLSYEQVFQNSMTLSFLMEPKFREPLIRLLSI